MSYVVGALAGVVGGLACVWFIEGVAGIAAGAVVAALLYLGVSTLAVPESKLGDVAASLVPNGEAAAGRIAEARRLEGKVRQLGAGASSEDVRMEARRLAADLERLASYVERQPATYRRLSHYLATYGEQCESVLENYLAIEHATTGEEAARAHGDVMEALASLRGAAQGELSRAAGAKVAELSADSDAVRRLMEMDGYTPDESPAASASAPSATPGVPVVAPDAISVVSTSAPAPGAPSTAAASAASPAPSSPALEDDHVQK